MIKKRSTNWNIALLYYLVVNLISIVPLLAAFFFIPRLTSLATVQILLALICLVLITLVALKLSSSNINRQYIIQNVSEVRNWALGYLVVLNGLMVLAGYRKNGDLPALLVGAIIILIVAVMYYFLTPKFIQVSLPQDVAASEGGEVEGGKKVAVGILKVAGLTVGGFILLIIILVLLIRFA